MYCSLYLVRVSTTVFEWRLMVGYQGTRGWEEEGGMREERGRVGGEGGLLWQQAQTISNPPPPSHLKIFYLIYLFYLFHLFHLLHLFHLFYIFNLLYLLFLFQCIQSIQSIPSIQPILSFLSIITYSIYSIYSICFIYLI